MQVLDSTLFMNTKLLLGVMITPSNNFVFIAIIGPISVPNDHLNAVFDEVVNLCRSCRNNALPWSPQENL